MVTDDGFRRLTIGLGGGGSYVLSQRRYQHH